MSVQGSPLVPADQDYSFLLLVSFVRGPATAEWSERIKRMTFPLLCSFETSRSQLLTLQLNSISWAAKKRVFASIAKMPGCKIHSGKSRGRWWKPYRLVKAGQVWFWALGSNKRTFYALGSSEVGKSESTFRLKRWAFSLARSLPAILLRSTSQTSNCYRKGRICPAAI